MSQVRFLLRAPFQITHLALCATSLKCACGSFVSFNPPPAVTASAPASLRILSSFAAPAPSSAVSHFAVRDAAGLEYLSRPPLRHVVVWQTCAAGCERLSDIPSRRAVSPPARPG